MLRHGFCFKDNDGDIGGHLRIAMNLAFTDGYFPMD